jgi:hypothetical protein
MPVPRDALALCIEPAPPNSVTVRRHPYRRGWTVMEARNYAGDVIREVSVPRPFVTRTEVAELYEWLDKNNRPHLELVS